MTIVKDDNGYMTFKISADGEYSHLSLLRYEDYINMLNPAEMASCKINQYGITTTDDILGCMIETDSEKFRIILGGEFNSLLYRGQVNDYPFMPSSQRYELFDGKERIRHCIEWVKKQEFIRTILSTPYNTRTKNFKVLSYNYSPDMEAFAKQYDFVSEYLDFTKNINTALFFAYTYFDNEKQKYFPIEDFCFNTPMLYTGDIKKIYQCSAAAVNKIGIQPNIRAKAQETMSLDVGEDRAKIKDVFIKTELPKNPKISRYIYELYEGGKLLFPKDSADYLADRIKKRKTLSEDLTEKYCEETKTDIEWLYEQLEELGYTIEISFNIVTAETEEDINKEIDECVIPYFDSNFIFRTLKNNN